MQSVLRELLGHSFDNVLIHNTKLNGGHTIRSLMMVHIADMWVRMQMWVFFTSLWAGGLGITCLDAMGASVDWYAMYKIPRIKSSSSWIITEGLGALYLDVNSPKWTLLNHAMNDTQQAVYQTLSQIYKGKNDDMMYIMYNDEPPEIPVSLLGTGGHTKGVVAFDKGSGFWLIHSVPNFPPKKADGYVFPGNAYPNGQSLLCVSFPYNQLGNVASQLRYNEAKIYDQAVPGSYIQDFHVLNDAIQGHTPSGPSYSSVLQMTSLGGQKFTSFAKSGSFGADLYDGLVAPNLQQYLFVETWTNGQGQPLDSNCSATYKVMKITSIKLAAVNVEFNQTVDHSKWAISSPAGLGGEKVLKFQQYEKWTCIGDINRMVSQFKRGGGTMCLQNPSVWQAYRNTVASYHKC